MTSVGVRELKTHMSKLLRLVREQGESIDITYYGEVVARLVPVDPPTQTAAEMTSIWQEIDQLTARVAELWKDDASAVDAVRAGRRDL